MLSPPAMNAPMRAAAACIQTSWLRGCRLLHSGIWSTLRQADRVQLEHMQPAAAAEATVAGAAVAESAATKAGTAAYPNGSRNGGSSCKQAAGAASLQHRFILIVWIIVTDHLRSDVLSDNLGQVLVDALGQVGVIHRGPLSGEVRHGVRLQAVADEGAVQRPPANCKVVPTLLEADPPERAWRKPGGMASLLPPSSPLPFPRPLPTPPPAPPRPLSPPNLSPALPLPACQQTEYD